MPRTSREPSPLEIVLTSRWPIAATMAVVCFVVGEVLLPRMLAANVFFNALRPPMQALSWLAGFGCGIVALTKFLHERSAGRTADRPGVRLPEAPARRSAPRSAPAFDPSMPSSRTEPFVLQPPTEWSLSLLQAIEWKRFEAVVAAYFRAKNFRCETIDHGPDGGVDGRLYFGDLPAPVGVVQCKAWNTRPVGVAPVRELLGVMTHEKVGRGYFCARGEFSKEAIVFAATNPIQLITGNDLLAAIARMPLQAQRDLLAVSTTGDYTTPTCPSCGIKLVERTIGGKAAWGCRHYPRCKVKIFRKQGATAAV